MTTARRLFILLLLAALPALALIVWRGGGIRTDLHDLLPADARPDTVRQAAEQRRNDELHTHILILLGAPDAQSAARAADALADSWQASALFSRIDRRITPDLNTLRDSLRTLDTALLPAAQAQRLLDDPESYFRDRAADLVNPFAASLLPLQDDWLGVARFIADKQPESALHLQDGRLTRVKDQEHWLLMRAHLSATPDAHALLALRADSRAHADANGYRVLFGGGALFAAQARVDAERESTRLSVIGSVLTLTLILAVFRTPRALWLFLPPVCGLLLGALATLAVCGHIHVLTLVIGTGLLGVLIDFPLHWLTPALFTRPWHGTRAMAQLLPVFCISLLITGTGYLLLWLTPLPVLRQTAVFSCTALLGAFLATACLLPARFRAYSPPMRRFSLPHLPRLPVLCLTLLAILGNRVEHWHDDLRDWMALSPDLLADARRIAELTGTDTGGQYLLVQADSHDGLLARDADTLAALAGIARAQGISQWLLPLATQHALHTQLHALADAPQATAPLRELGIPEANIRAALTAERRPVSLEESLQSPWAEPWRGLYLGQIDGQYAAIIRLNRLTDPAALHTFADNAACDEQSCVRLVDTPSHLNALFADTRNRATLLKLASWALAWGVLMFAFGTRRGTAILLPPLIAALATLGVLGWLGMAVSLFALFGVLLASAIGVDYSLYYLQSRDRADAKAATLTLAAITTALSFLLLATSQTPAVAAFGMAVSIGVAWNWLLTHTLLAKAKPS